MQRYWFRELVEILKDEVTTETYEKLNDMLKAMEAVQEIKQDFRAANTTIGVL